MGIIDPEDIKGEESDLESELVERHDEMIRETKRFYVLPVIMKPGKHQYFIKFKDSTEFY